MAEIGRQESATDVLNAQTRSNLWALDLDKLFEELDFIITPTTACLPFETGRMTP